VIYWLRSLTAVVYCCRRTSVKAVSQKKGLSLMSDSSTQQLCTTFPLLLIKTTAHQEPAWVVWRWSIEIVCTAETIEECHCYAANIEYLTFCLSVTVQVVRYSRQSACLESRSAISSSVTLHWSQTQTCLTLLNNKSSFCLIDWTGTSMLCSSVAQG